MSHYDIFKTIRGNRDTVFQSLLDRLEGKPARILEIGVARNLSPGARQGDGWSSMHFGCYVSNHGGHLDLVDVSNGSLSNCSILMDSIPMPFSHRTHLVDGRAFLKEAGQYDVILIDGSDDPGEMVECFELAKTRGRFILCDDFQAKGSLLRRIHPDFHLFTWANNPHEMALYDTLRPLTPTTLNMPLIQ